jgi:hypothetical protein
MYIVYSKSMLLAINKNKSFIFLLTIFLLFSAWWIYLQIEVKHTDIRYQLFSSMYGVVALLGSIYGFIYSRNWGGLKSVVGRAIFMFSLGLFAQEFGQLVYSYYYFANKTIPYPSLGDLGYFGSIPCYIYGVLLLAHASGVKFSLKSVSSKIQAVIIPIVMLIASYFIFLQGYQFDWSQPLKIFLDFGYPFGEALYVSFAFLTLLLSRDILGGIMKYRVLIILAALFVQYLCDFTFLYQANNNTVYPGGINDYMYLISYFIMSLGLLQFNIHFVRKGLEDKAK